MTASGADGVVVKGLGKPSSPSTARSEEDDPICQAIGDFGPWQLRLTFLLALFNFPCTWHIFAPTFQAVPVDFWCARPASLSGLPVDVWKNISHPFSYDAEGKRTYDACNIWDLDYSSLGILSAKEAIFSSQNAEGQSVPTVPCSRWEFDHSSFDNTIGEEWDLVCSRAHLKDVAEMMFLTGVALGGLASGVVSDRFGRKRTLMSSLAAQIVVGIMIAFNPWFQVYLALRCLLGFISVGIVFSGFVLCMELVGGRWRTISGLSYLFPVPISYITIAGIAYVVRGWKLLQLAITLPAVLLLGLYWVLPESPRWLLTMGRKEQVTAILQEAAKVNGISLPPVLDKHLQQITTAKTEPSAGILDLFRTPNIRRNSLVLYVIWFSVYLAYYGLVLNISNIGGDLFINTVLSGVVEIPAIAISIVFLLHMGRRWPLCITLVIGGVACLLTLLVPQGEAQWITIALAMVGKFSVSSSNVVIPVFTAELFPTVVRNLGVGASNVPAGVALMLVPYLWNMASFGASVPMAVLGTVAVVGGLHVLLLPETANRPLIGTLEEGEQYDRKSTQPTTIHSADVESQRSNSVTACNGSCPATAGS